MALRFQHEPHPYNPPPGLLGFALLFWGSLTGLLPIAILAALLLEARWLVPHRWDFQAPHFARAWTLSVLGLGIALYLLWADQNVLYIATAILIWTPIVFLPMALVSLYARDPAVPLHAFSYFARKAWESEQATGGHGKPSCFFLAYPYLALPLIGAAALNLDSPGYLQGAALIVFWALLSNPFRQRRARLWIAGIFALSFFSGGAIAQGLRSLQIAIEEARINAMNSRYHRDVDSRSSRIGDIADRKLSSLIRWRLQPGPGVLPPDLLMESAYNQFHRRLWTNQNYHQFSNSLHKIRPSLLYWSIPAVHPPEEEIEGPFTLLGSSNRGGHTILPLPYQTLGVDGLASNEVVRNELGAVRTDPSTPILELEVWQHENANRLAPVNNMDRQAPVHQEYAQLFRTTAEELGLASLPSAAAKVRAVREHFLGFRYSLEIAEGPSFLDTLKRFLVEDRTGHCELFATSTALLLRQAGVPTRYVTGYAVQEYHEGREEYVLRGIHRHAWVLAWVENTWQVVDTTPAAWFESDRAGVPPFQFVIDALQRWHFGFEQWRRGERDTQWINLIALVLLLSTLTLITVRLWRSRLRQQPAPADSFELARQGLDSALFGLVSQLEKQTRARAPGETLGAWWEAIRPSLPEGAPDLQPLLHAHYRLRFDPQLRQMERLSRDLARQAKQWTQLLPDPA
ncbi:MAG: transglutaminase domain-containing protein [Verrucomicrobiota bacterium]